MVGIGNDIHRLEIGRALIIGGINIPSEFGCVAHSDGDVLIHSLVDALLGAMGKGDIGDLFPDTDPKNKNAESKIFLEKVISMLKIDSFGIINIDAIIMLEKPKLAEYKSLIKKNIAELCEIEEFRVNIKAKTNEKLDSIGNSKAIACMCICQIERF